ncbi:MAG TPA: S-adenosylmethionine decarboxylase [Polyangiaceae bacterium]|nr:S-adenosylmethionine decarboxylase [Polyangiaceae bacterium]
MSGGTEWLVDGFGCDPDRLRDEVHLVALSGRIVAALGLSVVGAPLVHRFGGPGGVTALYLLSESHLAWHTYPETALATFNLYCCRARRPLDWKTLLESELGASSVRVETIARGLAARGLAAREHGRFTDSREDRAAFASARDDQS